MAKIFDYLETAGAEQLAADPVTEVFAGRFYFNTVSNVFKYYDGSSWISLGTSSVALNHYEMLVGDAGNTAVNLNTSLLGNYKADSGVLTFVDGNVNTGTDVITITSHGLRFGDTVYLTNSGGALPTGLTANTDYFVIVITSNTIQLAASPSDAGSGTPINITAAAGGGTHTVHTGGIVAKGTDTKVLPDANTTLTIADGFSFSAGAFTTARAVTLPSTGVRQGAKYFFHNPSGVVMSLKSSDTTTLSVSNSIADPSIAVGYVVVLARQDAPTSPSHWAVVDLYDEDQYSATTSGSSTNGASVFLRRTMNQVVARIIPALDGAAAGGDLTISNSNMPARFTPNTTILAGSSQRRNGSNRFCYITIDTGGTIVIGESDFGFSGSCFGQGSNIAYALR